jgi:hypothetical protein
VPPRYPHGPLAAGVIPAEDTEDLDPTLLALIEAAGGLWHAGDYYADPATIVASSRANGVRALRLDARDLTFLAELPELELLYVRTDGRPILDPISDLPRLRGLVIHVGALRGTIRLDAHPNLEWLALPLSGRGGRQNVPAFAAGHPGVRHLRLREVPFASLDEIATGFPGLRTLHVDGGERMRGIGDVARWADGLERLWLTWVRLRSFEGIEVLSALRTFGTTFSRTRTIAPLAQLQALRYLSILGTLPSLAPLAGHPGVRIARLTMPDDGDLSALASWPSLAALIGETWLGGDVPVPYLEQLPSGHPLGDEWVAATGSRRLLAP